MSPTRYICLSPPLASYHLRTFSLNSMFTRWRCTDLCDFVAEIASAILKRMRMRGVFLRQNSFIATINPAIKTVGNMQTHFKPVYSLFEAQSLGPLSDYLIRIDPHNCAIENGKHRSAKNTTKHALLRDALTVKKRVKSIIDSQLI